MILGIGTDIVKTERIRNVYEKFNDKFSNKILSLNEILVFEKITDFERKVSFLTKKFSAKESIFKAISDNLNEIDWKDISIINLKSGKPEIFLSQKLEKKLKTMFKTNVLIFKLSVSDEKEYVVTFAILETIF